MKVIHSAQELETGTKRVCLAIGFFDGVHLGHQQIIRQTLTDARQHEGVALVITFDNHPNTVVAPTRVPPLIYSLEKKLQTIESLGADALLLVHFDQPFSRQTGEEFIRTLAANLQHIGSVCVGTEFTFGNKRSGNVELLRSLGAQLNFAVHGVSAVSLDGQAVSSTRIRQAIKAGDLDSASQMLGRTYSLSGAVVKGDAVGHQLGFPTANIEASGLVLPPDGVYAAHVELQGCTYRAVLNLGYRPTLQSPAPVHRVEAHLLDFSGDLYGKNLEITFVEKLRDEKKFGSLQELQDQIVKDVAHARELF